jgi:meso-butanediol dehydrogenase / (S,S)-butanediol dehydrogenase / diacetyl reductase
MEFYMTDAPAAPHRPPDWMRRSQIEGLSALVVGGGSGIGAAAAKTWAANGGAVMVADLNVQSAHAVSNEITNRAGSAVHISMDAGSLDDIDRTVRVTLERFGRLDALINTSALVRPAPLETVSSDDWRAVFRVNVDGALQLATTCLPYLKQSPSPAIVTTGSLGGVFGRPNGGAYGPSKAALIALTRMMAMEWAKYGVRANAVIPGTIDTPLTQQNLPPAQQAERATAVPMGRLGAPDEVGDVIVFLASPAASYITAQAINVDGGHSESLLFAPLGSEVTQS